MFRKITNIIIIFLLLVSTTGITISKHYCGNELVSVKLFGETKSCCDNGKCCHTVSEFAQANNEFVDAATDLNFENSTVVDLAFFPIDLLINKITIDYTKKIVFPFKILPPPKIQSCFLALQSFLL